MKISQLIFFGFLFILLLFSFTTYINFQQSEAARDNAEYFARSTTIVRQSNRYQRNLVTIVSSLRGYLLTGDRSFIQAYDSSAVENETILKELNANAIDDPEQKALFDTIQSTGRELVKEFAPFRYTQVINDSSEGNIIAFHEQYKQQFAAAENSSVNRLLQSNLRRFINREYERREERRAILDETLQRTKRISFYLTAVSIIIGFLIATFLAYSISNRILRMVKMSNAIAAGDYKVHMQDQRRDELGKLSGSLNHMATVLDENFTLLKRKNAELDQFAHIVSHDLKAPLRGIDNVVSWIEEDHSEELSPKVQEYLQLIKGRLVRAENLIGGILSYARVGKEEQENELVSIGELVQEVAENIALRNGIELIVSQDLPTITTEKLPLFQVFSNLISNAFKYHDKEQGTVRVYHKEYTTHYEFFVADNGPGIATTYHNKIFQIFQTLQERDSFESTGVGLAIVKKILDARSETINLQSLPGEGATFSFTWSKT
jgi:signal transduction histidine kinase